MKTAHQMVDELEEKIEGNIEDQEFKDDLLWLISHTKELREALVNIRENNNQ